MPLPGTPDFAALQDFAEAPLYAAMGGAGYRLAPGRCAVLPDARGGLPFILDIVRGLGTRGTRAVLDCTLSADYPTDAAFAFARAMRGDATLSPIVPGDWQFRLLPGPFLQPESGILDPVTLIPDGFGGARLRMALAIEAALLLERMILEGGALPAVAEATMTGVSPRVAATVRFRAGELLAALHAFADVDGALPRAALVAFFARDTELLPLTVDWAGEPPASTSSFAETMADRVTARFGGFIAAATIADAPVIQLDPQDGAEATVRWSLSTPFVAARRLVMPVDLLSAAQQAVREGAAATVVRRRDDVSLPSLGSARIEVAFNLPDPCVGLAALGVTISFPPAPPHRPQARTETVLLEAGQEIVEVAFRLSPGEPLRYRYTPFAVVEEAGASRQIDGETREGEGSVLRLSPGALPIRLVRIRAMPALTAVARLTGTCSYVAADGAHAVAFTLGHGMAAATVAVPHDAREVATACTAVALDRSAAIELPLVEDGDAIFDVTDFPGYGPQATPIRVYFDDAASVRGLSILPPGAADRDDQIVSLGFTLAAPDAVLRWFSPDPFARTLRYRPVDAPTAPWRATEVGGAALTIASSTLAPPAPERVLVTKAASPVRETLPARLPTRRTESAPVALEAAVQPVAVSPDELVNDTLVFARTGDGAPLFVPRYSLAVDPVTNGQRYQIGIVQRDQAFVLRIGLDVLPAAEVAAEAPAASEMPHALAVTLDLPMAPPSTARRTLAFTDLTRDGAHLWAELTFASLMERDAVYRALTEPGGAAQLVVTRTIDVSVPQPYRPPPAGGGGRPWLDPPRPIWPPLMKADRLTLLNDLKVQPVAPAVTKLAMVTKLKPMLRETTRASALLKSRLVAADLTLQPRAIDKAIRKPIVVIDRPPVPKLDILDLAEEGGGTRVVIGVANWTDYSEDRFHRDEHGTPRTSVVVEDGESGVSLWNGFDVKRPQELEKLAFSLPPGTAVPATLRLRMTDSASRGVGLSDAVAIGARAIVPLPLEDRRVTLPQTVEPSPFLFSPALHPYIIDGGVPVGGGTAALIAHSLSWKGRFHSYLQDPYRRSTVYIFPDRFRIARRATPPFTPLVTVRVRSDPGGGDPGVVFDYLVAPHLDTQRLADARAQLLRLPGFGASSVEFKPLPTADVRFFIDRPAAAGSIREQRHDVALVLQGAIKDTLSMPLSDFKLLFDAMHQSTAALFIGRVEIDVPGGSVVTIPFEARFDDLEGEMLSYVATTDGTTLSVSLANAIESPIDIQTLDLFVGEGEAAVPAVIRPGAIPRLDLHPAEIVEVTATPAMPLPGGAVPVLTIGTGGVVVKVDAEAVWDAILDRGSTDCFRLVKVRIVPGVFAPVAGREAEQILVVLVEFERGGTAELSAGQLTGEVRIDYPIDDVIFGRPVTDEYRYTVTVIRANGTQQRDAEPRTSRSEIFFVSVAA